jgi:protein-disulfide isomerase
MRRILQTLAFTAALMTAGHAAATDVTAMTDDERAAFRDEVRSYLLDNPEVLLEAIDLLERRRAEAAQREEVAMIRANADDIFDDGYSWVGGNPEGDVTLVEFLDYRCGYCKRAFPEVESLVEADGNIRLVIKEFPILGEESVLASRFAIATLMEEGDDAYKALHDALMTLRGNVTATALASLAENLGIDAAAVTARMDTPEIDGVIAANQQLAQRLQIGGTPTFVLEDRMLRGYVPLEQMQAIVADARAAAAE